MDSDKALPKHFAEFAHEHFEGIRKEMSSDQESMYQRLMAAANRDVTIHSVQVKAALYAVAGVLCDREAEKPDAEEVLAYLRALLVGAQDSWHMISMSQVAAALEETRKVYGI